MRFEAQPAALLEKIHSGKKSNDRKARIVALNEAAQQQKVEAGMTAAKGQARCGELVLFHRKLEIEEAAQDKLLKLAMSYTPDFENTSPGICLMDLAGANAEEGWQLGWDIVEKLAAEHQWQAQVGFAETPDLALLIARQADPVRSIISDEWSDFLRQLPIDALDPPATITMVLTLWGISTIGDFLSLPHDEIAERLGPDALDLWERVSGKKSRLLNLVRPVKDFAQTAEFDFEVETLEPLMFSMRRLLETICARLSAAWLAAGEIHLRLDLSNSSPYERTFQVPDPCCDVELLFRMLDTHLENFTVTAPINGLRIEAIPARGARRQFHLFESGLRDPNRFSETLARLEGLLGTNRVGIPEPLNSHKPDSFRVVPFLQKIDATPAPVTKDEGRVTLGLPLRRLRPPVFANVKASPFRGKPLEIESVVIQGKISDSRGPWACSGDWWRERWSRAEWDVQVIDSKGQSGLYRLTRENKDEWKLEGVYG